MATKKQKRAAALAKREAFFEDIRRTGEQALRKSQEEQARRRRKAEAEARRRKDSEASKKLNAMFGKVHQDG